MSVWPMATMIFTWVCIVTAAALVPFLSRPDVRFGVSVPGEHRNHPAIVRVLRNYAVGSVSTGVAAASASVLLAMREVVSFGTAFAIAAPLYFIGFFSLYLRGHRQVERFKAEQGWNAEKTRVVAVDTSFRNRLFLIRLWYVLPFLLIVTNVLAVASYYENIPDVLPVHYGPSGQVERIASKSVGIVFTPNVIQLVLTFLLTGVQEAIIRSKQKIDPNFPETSKKQDLSFRRVHSAFLFTATIFLVLSFALVQCAIIQVFDPDLVVPIVLAVPVLLVNGAVILSARTGRGGYKLGKSGETVGTLYDGDDRHWK